MQLILHIMKDKNLKGELRPLTLICSGRKEIELIRTYYLRFEHMVHLALIMPISRGLFANLLAKVSELNMMTSKKYVSTVPLII